MLTETSDKMTFNIDNPKENTTLASIKLALAPALATNSWCSSNGATFIRVNGATVVETSKTKLSDEGSEISITPREATITTSGNTGNQTFVVEGMTIQGYSFQYLSGESTITPNLETTTIDKQANTITATFNTPNTGTAYYNFIITSGAYTFAIPVTITRS